MSLSSLPRRSSAVLQSSSMSIPYQLVTGQFAPHRRPTIGAPDVMLTAQPSASLKRRAHIRRTSRSGNSPTDSEFSARPPPPPKPEPLTTAFMRNLSASTATTTQPLTRRPTLMDSTAVEWRDSPRYQPNVSSRADLSRRSTVASVYSMPSAGGHESRRSTQENWIQDWSFVEQALQNRGLASPPPSHSSQSPVYSNPSVYPRTPSRSNSTAGLSRGDTAHVRTLLLGRRSGYDMFPESPAE